MHSDTSKIVRSALLLVSLVAVMPVLSFADSIKLQGKVYHNVYVSPGNSMHYVRFAVDGSLVSIPNSEIDDNDVIFSDTAEERKIISNAWKAKRSTSLNRDTLTFDEWRRQMILQANVSNEDDGPLEIESKDRQKSDFKILTKDSPSYARSTSRGSGRGEIKKFVNSDGVSALTNIPGHFKGKPDYLEVDFEYETIVVPEKFKGSTPQLISNGTIDEVITHYASLYKLKRSLVYAVIKQESNGNPRAVSKAGARGLMQLMPGTAQDMGVFNIFDPVQNIAGGTQYLSKMSELFKGDTTLILAGYNAGPGNVKKYKGVPPFEETQNYVRRVQQLQRQYERNGMPYFEKLASLN